MRHIPHVPLGLFLPLQLRLGRGYPVIQYIGNKKFRELVQTRKAEYVLATRHETKNEIARQVLDEIHRRQGRFLRRINNPADAKSLGVPEGVRAAWSFVDVAVALEKCKQALRDQSLPPSPEMSSPPVALSSTVGDLLSALQARAFRDEAAIISILTQQATQRQANHKQLQQLSSLMQLQQQVSPQWTMHNNALTSPFATVESPLPESLLMQQIYGFVPLSSANQHELQQLSSLVQLQQHVLPRPKMNDSTKMSQHATLRTLLMQRLHHLILFNSQDLTTSTTARYLEDGNCDMGHHAVLHGNLCSALSGNSLDAYSQQNTAPRAFRSPISLSLPRSPVLPQLLQQLYHGPALVPVTASAAAATAASASAGQRQRLFSQVDQVLQCCNDPDHYKRCRTDHASEQWEHQCNDGGDDKGERKPPARSPS